MLIVLIEFFSNNFIYGFPWLSFSLVHSNSIFGSSLIYFSGTYFTSYITVLIFLFAINIKINKFIKFFLKFNSYRILEEMIKNENISTSCNPEKRSYLNNTINKRRYNNFDILFLLSNFVI